MDEDEDQDEEEDEKIQRREGELCSQFDGSELVKVKGRGLSRRNHKSQFNLEVNC